MSKIPLKMFIVRKYIMATSAKDALRKDLKTNADEVWLDEDFKKKQMEQLPSAIGFSHNNGEE